MAKDRTGYAPWSLTREAGVQSATVDGTIAVPQNIQPVLSTGFVDYKRKGDLMHLTHTEVPKALEGKGVGSALVKYALQASKNEGKKVVSLCSFVSGYIERHPELESYLAR